MIASLVLAAALSNTAPAKADPDLLIPASQPREAVAILNCLVKDDGQVRVRRLARADEVLTGLRRFRGKLPAAARLSRDDAHER